MRVIHLACVAPPQTGGIGAAAYKEVALLNDGGILTELFAPQVASSETVPFVRRIPTVWSFGNAARLNLASVLHALQEADVVHVHYPFYGTAGQIVALRRTGRIKRLVLTLHMDATARGWKGMVFDAHRRFFQASVLNAADALLVSSKDYATHSSFKPWAEKCIELPFGVDEELFHPASDRVPAKQILFVGGMDTAHAFKGVDVLLEALAKLPGDVHAKLVGDGDLRASFEARAAQLGLVSRVSFSGKLSTAELAEAYRSADVFAFPSTSGAEAFGLVALEAQASGLPVVASDLPGVRTVVANNETGALVPARDAAALAERLGFLLDHSEVAKTMGERARARVLETFTWKKHYDGLRSVYERICASPS